MKTPTTLLAAAILLLIAPTARAVLLTAPSLPFMGAGGGGIPSGQMYTVANDPYGVNPGVGNAIMTLTHGGDIDPATPVRGGGGGGIIRYNADPAQDPADLFIEVMFDHAVLLRVLHPNNINSSPGETYTWSVAGQQIFYTDFNGGNRDTAADSLLVDGGVTDPGFAISFGARSLGGGLNTGREMTVADWVLGAIPYSYIPAGTIVRLDYNAAVSSGQADAFQLDVLVIPEPSGAALAAVTLGALALRRRRRV